MKIISSHKPSPRGAHQQYLNRSKVSGTSRHYNDSYEPSVSETIGAYAAPTGMAVGAIAGGVLVAGMFSVSMLRNRGRGGSYIISFKETLKQKVSVPYGVAIAFGSSTIFYQYAVLIGLFG